MSLIIVQGIYGYDYGFIDLLSDTGSWVVIDFNYKFGWFFFSNFNWFWFYVN